MLENKVNMIEAAAGLKAGMFIHVHHYVNKHGEIQDATFHADANYKNTHERSADMLDKIEQDADFSVEIVRNSWIDANGTENTRKAKGRTLKTGIKEIVTATDKDLPEAIAKVRKGIVDPRKVTDNFEKIANSTYENDNTGKIYMRNVLIHSKKVVQAGVYDVVCSARVNVIADSIRDLLPIGEYRSYILDDEMVDMPDGSKLPRFEYVALMNESISSSSSSEE